MAWFKPARNRDHPGDPPPKWAPLSRKGRLALLVTVIAGVVIALLIIATRTAGPAEATDGPVPVPEGTPPPWVGGRVAVPEAGFAVTVPEGWLVELVEEGSDLGILIADGPERFGPEVELQHLLIARGPGGRR